MDAASDGSRLDKFLAAGSRLGSRGRASTALERGKIFVNEAEATPRDSGRRLVPGDVVRHWLDRPGSARRRLRKGAGDAELSIVYEDAALIVVNKPAGLLTVPLPRRDEATSVEEMLVAHLRSHGKRRPLVVHRIDRDTSGLVVFATRADALARLKDQFRRHEAERTYLAVVYGHPSPPTGTWSDYLVWDQNALIQKEGHRHDPRAKEARCRYRTIERLREAALLEVNLITGRRNQIRLQARLRGHTLVGEQRYTFGPTELRPISFKRQALHATKLRFIHPVSGQAVSFEAPMPADMAELVRSLKSGA